VAHHNTLALTLPTNHLLSQPSHSSHPRGTQMATWKRKGGGGHLETIEARLREARPEMSGWRCNIPQGLYHLLDVSSLCFSNISVCTWVEVSVFTACTTRSSTINVRMYALIRPQLDQTDGNILLQGTKPNTNLPSTSISLPCSHEPTRPRDVSSAARAGR
jgi:hypothetical protein